MEQLKRMRAIKGVSQQVVADYLGCTRQTYSNYENGNRSPDYETLLKLAAYYDTSVDFLLRGEAPEGDGEYPAHPRLTDTEIKAAFFEGADTNLTKDDIDALWADAKDYIQFKIWQRKDKT